MKRKLLSMKRLEMFLVDFIYSQEQQKLSQKCLEKKIKIIHQFFDYIWKNKELNSRWDK